jgi:hypothetical protein
MRDANRRLEARAMLVEICCWFTEGFDPTDLFEIEAKTPLGELSARLAQPPGVKALGRRVHTNPPGARSRYGQRRRRLTVSPNSCDKVEQIEAFMPCQRAGPIG